MNAQERARLIGPFDLDRAYVAKPPQEEVAKRRADMVRRCNCYCNSRPGNFSY